MRTDLQIQTDVMEQMKWEPILNAAEIGVSVSKGVVTLTGIVDSYNKKSAAEGAAKKVNGVKAVAEELQVGLSPTFRKTDTEIAQAVVQALRWNSSVPDEQIKIKVEDGVVTLEGDVAWEFQRLAAKAAIEALTGVKRINNFINIKPMVTPSNIKEKISAAFLRSATIDSSKVNVAVSGSQVTLTGKVRSFTESQDAVAAAWAAPGVNKVVNKLDIEQEEFAY